MRAQVFNLQRLAVLTATLGASPPNAEVIWEAMRDKVHQPWREGLVSSLFNLLTGPHSRRRLCAKDAGSDYRRIR